MTNIQPIGDRVYIKVEEPTAGALNLSSKPTTAEKGTVIAIGPDCTLPLKPGDTILFKAWAMDMIVENEVKYHFISQATQGICAIAYDLR